MKQFVFLGPTLSLFRAREILPDATYLPPAQCGDIIRVLENQPSCIALIDGLFEQTAAIWHKEILLALHSDIPVFGASSMGALRAAELSYFGMQGVGKIYKAYQARELEDDDEVTLVHTDKEAGFQKITEPMVNVRETLLSACAAGIISATQCRELIVYAKNIFYKERTWKKILDYLDDYTAARVRPWIQANYVDQKALDAEALLQKLARQPLEKPAVKFRLNRTIFLEKLIDHVHTRPDMTKLQKIYAQVHKALERLQLTTSLMITDQHQIEGMIQAVCRLSKIVWENLSAEDRDCVGHIAKALILLEQYLTEEGMVPSQAHLTSVQNKIRHHLALPEDVDAAELYLMAQVYFMCQEFCAQSSELFMMSRAIA